MFAPNSHSSPPSYLPNWEEWRGSALLLPGYPQGQHSCARIAKGHVKHYSTQAMHKSAAHFIDDLAARGQYHFTTAEAATELGRSLPATRAALRRLKEAGRIADPARGFFVIVPPEYRRIGCLPPEQFVPQLMEQLGETHYVALLSAAELLGAAHHRPQTLQVMVATNRRPIVCGAVQVRFFARGDLRATPTVRLSTPRGMVTVASAEATALELVGYAQACGGLEQVATVLAELAEALDGVQLAALALQSPAAWVQRLGYLLDLTGHAELADYLLPALEGRCTEVVPLVAELSRTGAERDARWRIALNASIAFDA
jgi:predicted transcriptional regulator of viral defense system